jgi:hypothetical protein
MPFTADEVTEAWVAQRVRRIMITLQDVHDSPSLEKEVPVKDFELAVRELIDDYRKTGDQAAIAAALRIQAELVEKDEVWPTANKAAEEAAREQGIQPPQPTESEVKREEAAKEAAKAAEETPPPAEKPVAPKAEEEDEGKSEKRTEAKSKK